MGNTSYGTYVDDAGAPTAAATFSVNFSSLVTSLSQEYLFRTGGGNYWLLATRGNLTASLVGTPYGLAQRTAALSSTSAVPCLFFVHRNCSADAFASDNVTWSYTGAAGDPSVYIQASQSQLIYGF